MEALLTYRTDPGPLHAWFPWLVQGLDWIAAVIALAAMAILILGAARFIAGGLRAEVVLRRDDRIPRTNALRVELGRYILAALELFIVADIIRTALSLAFADILFLAALVAIRSIISWILDRELGQLQKELSS